MKLHVLNDLHIEFGAFEPPGTEADVVVLAGDIGVGVEGLRWAGESFPGTPVVYVPGNHEFYGHDVAILERLRAEAPANVHVLDDEQAEIGGVRFLGCVLWSDFALHGEARQASAMRSASTDMNDFAQIRRGDRAFQPRDALEWHLRSRRWLAERLCEPFAGQTVVVTHHAPSPRSIAPRYAGSPLSPAFASDLESLMETWDIALWVHGHLHDSFDYEVAGTRVVCNPRGYHPYWLNGAFARGLVIAL